MTINAFEIPGIILAAGGAGGLVNALISQNGFILPKSIEGADGTKIWRPGIIGNVAVSAVAALVSWGLYGSGTSLSIFAPATQNNGINLTYSAVVGAILVGIGGARWLTSEVDKNLLRSAAVAAAGKDASGTLAETLAKAAPASALSAAMTAH